MLFEITGSYNDWKNNLEVCDSFLTVFALLILKWILLAIETSYYLVILYLGGFRGYCRSS